MEYGCYTKGRWRWRGGEEDPQVRLPTFTRAIPRPPPPAVPAGLDSCDEDTVRRWQLDSMMFSTLCKPERVFDRTKGRPSGSEGGISYRERKTDGLPPGIHENPLEERI